MVGKTSSIVGLIAASIFMLAVGYALTLNVYQDQGAYVVFYWGRYYLGIACMIVGGLLFFVGVALPFVWPKPKTGEGLSVRSGQGRGTEKEKTSFQNQISVSEKSPAVSSVERKLKALSMQSTYGSESMRILREILQLGQIVDSMLVKEISVDEKKVKKSINLLLNLGLLEKRTGVEETYFIPSGLEKEVKHYLDQNKTLP